MSIKQDLKLITGMYDQIFDDLEAMYPMINANRILWVGPLWKALPLFCKIRPNRTSISGKFERMIINIAICHLLKLALSFEIKLWVANPIAA